MPEEINRLLTDAISDLLFCTEKSGVENLAKEGIPPEKVFLVGNVMIDTLLKNKSRAEGSKILAQLKLQPGSYAVLTLHRPANVDDPVIFGRLLQALKVVQEDMPIVFPVHPRTRNNLTKLEVAERIKGMANIRFIDPMGYLDFLKLMSEAKLVLTDSGGIQEETTILNVPCITVRNNTERPITVEFGSNIVAGTDPDRILAAYRQITSGKIKHSKAPPLWDGHAAERIAKILAERL
jgi:UDP-N-acetylglucosamine 2-epimerase (non-hydrolysing)